MIQSQVKSNVMSNFGKLAIKDWKDSYADVAVSGCIFLGIYCMLWVLNTVVVGVASGVDDRKMEFWITVSLFSVMIPGTVYGEVNDRNAGIGYALLPASVLEKYLVMLLFCLVVYPALFISFLALTDSALALLGNSNVGYIGSFWTQILELDDGYLKIMMCCSFFVYGNLLFRTKKRGKTLIVGMALFLLWGIVRRYGGVEVDVELAERYLTCLSILVTCISGYFRMLKPI